MKLIFATGNKHKIKEVREILEPDRFTIHSLQDIGYLNDIPETGTTMEENALIKARSIYTKFNINVFAEDSGLEVAALNNQPGIMSTRFAGPAKDSNDNIQRILELMKNEQSRKANFRSVIALIYNGNEHIFEGILHGEISAKPSGKQGFGYDPIFIPEGSALTLAELGNAKKNRISHRYSALQKMEQFLQALATDRNPK